MHVVYPTYQCDGPCGLVDIAAGPGAPVHLRPQAGEAALERRPPARPPADDLELRDDVSPPLLRQLPANETGRVSEQRFSMDST
eukprot:1189616-Prorocentrum_minimum.AAC.2